MYDFSDYVSNKESFWDALASNSIYQCIYQWIVLVLLIVILVFAIMTFVAIKKGNGRMENVSKGAYGMNAPLADKVVFCKKCGNEFNAVYKICPHCGTKRMA